MQIQINGELRDFNDKTTITELVEILGFTGQRIAVEINLEIVPRSQHQKKQLQPGDKVEIVQAIGGGQH